eukprot:SAG31_NODE_39358_length_289_cov_0.400000_1_plen_44_part_10
MQQLLASYQLQPIVSRAAALLLRRCPAARRAAATTARGMPGRDH